jgi:hypothetical protein
MTVAAFCLADEYLKYEPHKYLCFWLLMCKRIWHTGFLFFLGLFLTRVTHRIFPSWTLCHTVEALDHQRFSIFLNVSSRFFLKKRISFFLLLAPACHHDRPILNVGILNLYYWNKDKDGHSLHFCLLYYLPYEFLFFMHILVCFC